MNKMTMAAVCALMMGAAPPCAAAASGMTGIAVEKAFDAAINPDDLRDWMKTLTAQPNHVGAAHNKANAEFQLDLFKSWGWDARIETFDVLYPTPKSITVELLGPGGFRAAQQEPAILEDQTSGNTADALPPFVAYGADGDVTADLVYVNYGMPDDYKMLERLGISVKGKIVLVRYGAGWRGLKPKLAQEHGAVGCIIYSDPADDGYAQDDIYPKGSMRPEAAVQRGSIMDMPVHPGDPLTPDAGATGNAKRLKREEAATILKIPVVPISYGDARRFLEKMGGPLAPQNWRGGLPLAYHVGPGAARVHLAVTQNWDLKPIYNVIATMKGKTRPDEWVVRGNHRDGWVFGASDPMSGQVAMMAEMKAIGALAKGGWRPERTLVYASWDGEEAGLLGSTEWVEAHAAELKKKAILYVNTDGGDRGFLRVEGNHSWQHLANDAARDVTDPETGVSVHARLAAKAKVDALSPNASAKDRALAEKAERNEDFPIGPLGSGSDYSAFVQHLGIPSFNLYYSGEADSSGVYHSIYDSFDHYSRFMDPGFKYGATLAKTAGRLVLRAAEAPVPPQRFADFASTVAVYLDEVKTLESEKRKNAEAVAKLVSDGSYRLADDPLHPLAAPKPDAAPPHLEWAALENAVDQLKASAGAFDAARAAAGNLPNDKVSKLNAQLGSIEQTLLDARGLPGRPWYRNLIYAPGSLTGYGAKTLPGVREAIEQERYDDANTYIGRTAAVLDAYAARLDAARTIFMEK